MARKADVMFSPKRIAAAATTRHFILRGTLHMAMIHSLRLFGFARSFAVSVRSYRIVRSIENELVCPPTISVACLLIWLIFKNEVKRTICSDVRRRWCAHRKCFQQRKTLSAHLYCRVLYSRHVKSRRNSSTFGPKRVAPICRPRSRWLNLRRVDTAHEPVCNNATSLGTSLHVYAETQDSEGS